MNESLELMQKNYELRKENFKLQEDNEGLKIFIKYLTSITQAGLFDMDRVKDRLELSILISQQTKNQINEHWTNLEREQEISKLNTEAVS